MSKPVRSSIFLSIFSAALLSACATNPTDLVDYPEHTEIQVRPFRYRHFQHIAQNFRKPSETIGPDRLVFLLDRSLALYELGKYRESNKVLWEAEKLIKISRFDTADKLRAQSVRNIQRKFYHGDPHEAAMLSVYHSLNYAFIGREEDAIHEARRASHKLERINQDGGASYPLDAFYYYLPAIMYERQGLWKEAYVDYKRAYAKMPNSKSLQRDLLRTAAKLNSDIDVAKWRGVFGLSGRDVLESYRSLRDFGSIVIVYQNGFHSVKQPHEKYRELPVYKSAENQYVSAQVYVNDKIVAVTDRVLDIDALAFTDSERREQIYEKDKALGFPTRRKKKEYDSKRRVGYQSSGVSSVERLTEYLEADLRRWTTLPRDLQMARVNVPPGIHRVMLRLRRKNGRWGPIRDLGEVVVRRPGDIVLRSYRSFNEAAGNVR